MLVILVILNPLFEQDVFYYFNKLNECTLYHPFNTSFNNNLTDLIICSISELPIWNYDGSSTYQAEGGNSDVYLHPVAIYRDPFRRGNNILVMCETYSYDGTPTGSNHRKECAEVAAKCAAEEPWFGIEQEYTLLDVDNHPLGFTFDLFLLF